MSPLIEVEVVIVIMGLLYIQAPSLDSYKSRVILPLQWF